MKKSVAIIFFIVFFFVGLIFVSVGVNFFLQSVQSQSWSQTEGIIIQSNIYSGAGKHSSQYGADIVYQYQVNGINYTSNDVLVGHFSSSDYNYAQQLVNKYYVGKTVTVFYNPNDPSNAILEPGATIFAYMFILFGLLPIIVAIVILYFLVIRKKLKNIELILDKSTFFPGETIRGKVSINFNKPVKAEALKVTFEGQKVVPSGKNSSSVEIIYHDEIILDKEKEYMTDFYSFEIKIPEDIIHKMSNWIDEKVPYDLAKKIYTASQNLGLMRAYDEYFVEVFLEIRGKIDIRNSIQIKILA